jgi:hypothetical protein
VRRINAQMKTERKRHVEKNAAVNIFLNARETLARPVWKMNRPFSDFKSGSDQGGGQVTYLHERD